MENKLKFIVLGGTTQVTENMYVYEYDGNILIVDCGVGFPEEGGTYGIDLKIPDFSYVAKNKDKVRAIIISHGHEDHLGALPFLLQEVKAPIYSTRLVAGFIEDKLIDYGIRNVKPNVFDPERGPLRFGPFSVDTFRVSHSVPDSVGLCITSPVGKVFHVPDYKFDWTPVDQKPFDIAKAARLAKDGVLALASDCLGSTTEGYTESELEIERTIELIVEEAKHRVYFTTISSNISRMQQVIRASNRLGRKVVFVGRSIEKKAEIAKKLGYLEFDKGDVVLVKEGQRLPKDKVTFIVSGSYGQVGSSLYRMALGEHQFLKIEKGDVVVFSGDPAPPGTEQAVNAVVDNLIEQGAEVHYYDTQEDLHVSGHGSQKDIEMLLALVQPRYLLPIGGTIRHMRAFTMLAERMGFRPGEVFELRAGESLEIAGQEAKRGEAIPVRDILVDGYGIGDVGQVVLRDRKTLAKEGIVVVVIQVERASGKIVGRPDVISRGFVFAKKQQDFLNRAGDKLGQELRKKVKRADTQLMKELTGDFLSRFFFEETARRPIILPVVVEV